MDGILEKPVPGTGAEGARRGEAQPNLSGKRTENALEFLFYLRVCLIRACPLAAFWKEEREKYYDFYGKSK